MSFCMRKPTRGPAGLEKEGEITSPSKKVREKFWDLGRSDK